MQITVESPPVTWRKSSFCPAGECVEVARRNGKILLRSTGHPGNSLEYTPDEFQAFIAGVRLGEFDDLAGLPGDGVPEQLQVPTRKEMRRRLRQLKNLSQVDNAALRRAPSRNDEEPRRTSTSDAPEPRPLDYLEFLERRNNHATNSLEALQRQVIFDTHQSRMAWGATMRQLALGAGLMVLGAGIAGLIVVAGVPLSLAAGITLSGLASAAGGAGIRLAVTRIWGQRPAPQDRTEGQHRQL